MAKYVRLDQVTYPNGREVHYDTGTSDAHYYYNTGWQLLEERFLDGQGATLAANQYVWSPDYIDSPILRFHDANGDGDVLDQGDNTHYYTTDANHNVTSTIDATTGSVVEYYVYTAYGTATVYDNTWSNATTPTTNGPLYCGYFYDAEMGLYQVRNRYYDSGLSVFVSRDPIRYHAGDVNLYQYVRSRPLGFRDPLGLGTMIIVDDDTVGNGQGSNGYQPPNFPPVVQGELPPIDIATTLVVYPVGVGLIGDSPSSIENPPVPLRLDVVPSDDLMPFPSDTPSVLEPPSWNPITPGGRPVINVPAPPDYHATWYFEMSNIGEEYGKCQACIANAAGGHHNVVSSCEGVVFNGWSRVCPKSPGGWVPDPAATYTRLHRTSWGRMQWGEGWGYSCSIVTDWEIRDCLKNVPPTSGSHIAGWNDCQSDTAKALRDCCLVH